MIIKKRKGISTFIATLLLMVLAVSAGVVIYAYTMGYLGGFGSPTTMGGISVDTWNLDPTAAVGSTALTAYVRNIGKTSFTLDQVYVNGKQIPSANVTMGALLEGDVGTLTVKQGGKTTYLFQPSTTYDIKIIGVDNTQLSFQVKK